MTSLRSLFRQNASNPRIFPRRALGRRPVIFALLAVLSICQTGCNWGLFSKCNGCFGLRNFRERVFPGATGCCGGDLGAQAAPLIYGTPGAMSPAPSMGMPMTPTAPMGTAIPGPVDSASPSTLDPIEPTPSATPGAAPLGADSSVKEGAKPSTGKAVYEAKRPRFDNQGRGSTLARSVTSSPEPTPRSAQGLSTAPKPTTSLDDSFDLDNLPPLDLPREVSQSSVSQIPVDPLEDRPTAKPGPAPEAVELSSSAPLAPLLPSPLSADMTVAPGIRRFSGVDDKLCGGSLPSASGLDWLSETGYKTILDLREPAEVPADFAAEVIRRGMSYRSLPITLTTIDADHLTKFEAEISKAGARPLYFFDNDGNRAGALWFIRRITIDKVDAAVAQGDAAEIGLGDGPWRKVAQDYVDRTKVAPNS